MRKLFFTLFLSMFTVQGLWAAIPTVTNVDSLTAPGTLKIGDPVAVRITWSEAINIDALGPPQLTLETGAVDQVVNCPNSVVGQLTIICTYNVVAGNESLDLDYATAAALNANGAAIIDTATLGFTADTTLPTPGGANSLSTNENFVIDGIIPTITNITSTTANGSFTNLGGPIAITVQFSETVNVNGSTPDLTLDSGAVVNYSSGSPSNILTFNYTVGAGQDSADLEATVITDGGGGQLQDTAGNVISTTLPTAGGSGSLSFNKDLIIDNTQAIVSSISSSTPDGTYGVGDNIDITVTFSEPLTLSSGETLTVNLVNGGTAVIPSFTNQTSVSGTYTVLVANSNSADLNNGALVISGGTLSDAVGINADLATITTSLSVSRNLVINTTIPTVANVTAGVADATYGPSSPVIPILVQFSETVNVTGNPQITLETGTADAIVDYSSGTGTTTLTFNYQIQSGEATSALDYKSTLALILNSVL